MKKIIVKAMSLAGVLSIYISFSIILPLTSILAERKTGEELYRHLSQTARGQGDVLLFNKLKREAKTINWDAAEQAEFDGNLRYLEVTSRNELNAFIIRKLSGKKREEIKSVEDIDSYILIPAFMLSEIKKAFIIGIVIFIPFIVIDLVVASTLMSMGMFMLPPVMISLPFKIILFILVDGWHLITYNLVLSYGG